ncbi:MAG: hypothetical protein J0L99_05335 [Chitinophagales bacterium]|nr:hypothetical protein [Chitinophagales bacterium]
MLKFFGTNASYYTYRDEMRYPNLIHLDWRWIDILGPKSCIQEKYTKPFDFEPEFPRFELDADAIPADILNVHNLSEFLIVSKKFYNVIQSFNLGNYQVFERDLITAQGNILYYILYFPDCQDEQLIDWSKSRFLMEPRDGGKKYWAMPQNSEAYIALLPGTQLVWEEYLVTKMPPIGLDMFRLSAIRNFACHYVSPALRQALEAEKMIGVNFLKETVLHLPDEGT